MEAIAAAPARIRSRPDNPQRYRKDASPDPDAARRRRATANRTLTILKAALNRAWREGKVPSDAEWRRVEPFEAVDAARIRYLSIAEAQRIINAAEPSFRMLVQAALQTGARYGELAALRVEDFNVDAGTVTICASKTNKVRHVILTEEGVELFSQATAGRDGLIFTTAAGEPWRKSMQARPMSEACRNARVKPIGFHGLRHTWASLAAMNAVPLLIIAKNLGHSDTRMVERHYGHLCPSYMADAIRAGAPRFGALPSSVTPLTR